MKYFLKLLPQPFETIKNGTKKIEGRPPKTNNDRYTQMKQGDEIIFTNIETGETLETKIIFVHHYENVKDMLEKEDMENILSSKATIDQGIESYNKINDYRERIKKFGIYAIGIKLS